MIEVVEPATEQVMAEVPRAGRGGGRRRGRAREGGASRPGAPSSPGDRAALLHRLANALEERAEDLATLEARNAGKPIADARGEMEMVVQTFRYYAGAPERLLGHTIPVAGGVDMTFREPLGVVGLIVPWNFPLAIASWKVAPALAAGQHGRAEAGRADAADRARARADRARGGAARGRAERGRRARAASAGSGWSSTRTWRRSRSPARPRSGAGSPQGAAGDDQARDARAGRQVGERRSSPTPTWSRRPPRRRSAVFGNAGQDCCARSRILVERSALDRFLEALERGGGGRCASATRSTSATQMGPLISADQRETVASYVADDAPVAIRGIGARRARLLVSADRARARSRTTTARRARRSSARSPA